MALSCESAARTDHALTVAVCTFNRPEGLGRLFSSLSELKHPEGAEWTHTLVIDNDPGGSAQVVAEQWADKVPGLTYVCEPRPGISAARNRGLAETSTRFLAWIDDDETCSPDWLTELLAVQHRNHASAVVGHVEMVFEDRAGISEARLGCGAFELGGWSEGTHLATLMSGNVLFDRSIIPAQDLKFDEAFGITGGSDHLLGVSLAALGHVLVAAPAAQTTEWIPAKRTTAAAVALRGRRAGNTLTKTDLHLAKTPMQRFRVTRQHLPGTFKMLLLPLAALAGRLGADERRIEQWRFRGNVGLGQLLGLFGTDVVGYGRRV